MYNSFRVMEEAQRQHGGGGGGGRGGGVTVLVPFVHHKSHTDWPGVEHKNNKKCMCL